MQISYKLALAAARYLCKRHSVGLYRLVDDMLRDPALLPVFAELGAIEVVDGVPTAPRPGTPEWWRAYAAVKDAVLYLEARGVVKYLSQVGVVNWIGKPCSSPALTPTSTPPENSTPSADGDAEKLQFGVQKPAEQLQNGGRKRRTLVDFL